MLRKVAGCSGKIERNAEWEAEYNAVMGIMKNQIKLSPYDPTKKLKLIIDRAKSVGTGFLLIQHINDIKPERGINIINVGLCLLPDDKDYSQVEAEARLLLVCLPRTTHQPGSPHSGRPHPGSQAAGIPKNVCC